MIRFSKEKVLLLHQIMAEATGGSVGLRDDMLLIPEISNILTAVFQHYVYGRRILIAWLVKTAVPSPP